MKEKDTNALYYKLQVLNNPHLLKASFLYLIIFLLFYLLSFLLVGYHLYSSDRSKQLLSLSLSLDKTITYQNSLKCFLCNWYIPLCKIVVKLGFFFFFGISLVLHPYKLSTLHEHFIKLVKGDKKVIVQTQDTPNTLHSTSNTRHITWLIKL